MVKISLAAVCLVGGLLFFLIRETVFLIRSLSCTFPIVGTVYSLTERRQRYRSVFRPVIRYEYEGEVYYEEIRHAYSYDTHCIGENVNILINPTKPWRVILPRERKSSIGMICALLAATVFLCFYLGEINERNKAYKEYVAQIQEQIRAEAIE